jgi:hypothetical protein
LHVTLNGFDRAGAQLVADVSSDDQRTSALSVAIDAVSAHVVQGEAARGQLAF